MDHADKKQISKDANLGSDYCPKCNRLVPIVWISDKGDKRISCPYCHFAPLLMHKE